jgi:acetoin utilization deacetylase AcuC-like enzyme
MKIIFDEAATRYGGSEHPERPERLLSAVPHLRKVLPQLVWERPFVADDKNLLPAHDEAHLARLHRPINTRVAQRAALCWRWSQPDRVSPLFRFSDRRDITPNELKPWVSVT